MIVPKDSIRSKPTSSPRAGPQKEAGSSKISSNQSQCSPLVRDTALIIDQFSPHKVRGEFYHSLIMDRGTLPFKNSPKRAICQVKSVFLALK